MVVVLVSLFLFHRVKNLREVKSINKLSEVFVRHLKELLLSRLLGFFFLMHDSRLLRALNVGDSFRVLDLVRKLLLLDNQSESSSPVVQVFLVDIQIVLLVPVLTYFDLLVKLCIRFLVFGGLYHSRFGHVILHLRACTYLLPCPVVSLHSKHEVFFVYGVQRSSF